MDSVFLHEHVTTCPCPLNTATQRTCVQPLELLEVGLALVHKHTGASVRPRLALARLGERVEEALRGLVVQVLECSCGTRGTHIVPVVHHHRDARQQVGVRALGRLDSKSGLAHAPSEQVLLLKQVPHPAAQRVDGKNARC